MTAPRSPGCLIKTRDGKEYVEQGTNYLSSIPVTELIQNFDPPAPSGSGRRPRS